MKPILIRHKQFAFHILLIAVFAFGAMSSIIFNGVTSGNDSTQHYQFAQSIHHSIVTHEFYPSFAELPNHGFGDVGLRFYPPLSYYVLAIVYIFVQDWYFSAMTAFFLIFLVGGIGIYLWAKEELSPQQAIIAAAIYTFAPYHLNQIYNNFLFAEFSATAIIPFCFLFLTRVCRKNNKFDVLGLAVFYAFLILTHLPLTIISSLTLGIYGLLLLRKETFLRVAAKLFIAVGTALTLSSFYWLRMVSELDWVKHASPQYSSNIWDYRINFLLKPENILNFQTDVLCLWLADIMLLAILFVSLPSVILLLRKQLIASKFVTAVGIVLCVAVFMTTPLSSIVWDNLTFLQKTQFPWRWLAIISAFGAIFASIGINCAAEKMKESNNIFLPIGLGSVLLIFIFTSAFIIKCALYHPREEFNQQMTAIATAESCDCWWTTWANRSAFSQTEKVVAGTRQIEIQNRAATEKKFTIASGQPEITTVAIFYYPHWKMTINNQPIEISPTENGLISFPVPAEKSEINIYFQEPDFIRFAFYLSALSWMTDFGFFGGRRYSIFD